MSNVEKEAVVARPRRALVEGKDEQVERIEGGRRALRLDWLLAQLSVFGAFCR